MLWKINNLNMTMTSLMLCRPVTSMKRWWRGRRWCCVDQWLLWRGGDEDVVDAVSTSDFYEEVMTRTSLMLCRPVTSMKRWWRGRRWCCVDQWLLWRGGDEDVVDAVSTSDFYKEVMTRTSLMLCRPVISIKRWWRGRRWCCVDQRLL